MSALLVEIAQAALGYYAQIRTIRLTATDFDEWLTELPPAHRAEFAKRGFEACRRVWAFQRFCLEWRGLSLREYLAHHLSHEAYCYWRAHESGRDASLAPESVAS